MTELGGNTPKLTQKKGRRFRRPFFVRFALELEPELTLERTASGLCGDLTKGDGSARNQVRIDRKVRNSRLRVIQHVECIGPEPHALRFRDPERLFQIRVEAPQSRSLDRVATKIAARSRPRILQNNQTILRRIAGSVSGRNNRSRGVCRNHLRHGLQQAADGA